MVTNQASSLYSDPDAWGATHPLTLLGLDPSINGYGWVYAESKRPGHLEVKEGGVNAAIVADIVGQLEEDKPIWEHKVYRQLPVLCDGDGPIPIFRRWTQQFYR